MAMFSQRKGDAAFHFTISMYDYMTLVQVSFDSLFAICIEASTQPEDDIFGNK